MEKFSEVRATFACFAIDNRMEQIAFYTPTKRVVTTHKLKNFSISKQIHLKFPIVFISFSYLSQYILVLTRNSCICYNLENLNLEFNLIMLDGIEAYLLESNHLVALFNNNIMKFYNEFNQEELSFYYEKAKIFENRYVVFQMGSLITILNSKGKVIEERRVPISIHINFNFTLFNNELYVLNGDEISSDNFFLKISKKFIHKPDNIIVSSNYIYLIKGGQIFVHDKRENKNMRLDNSKIIHEKNNEYVNYCRFYFCINNVGRKKAIPIFFDQFVYQNNLLFVLKNTTLGCFREIADECIEFIECLKSFNHIISPYEYDVLELNPIKPSVDE
ncbi:hypothetical protein EDEG_00370 [Edhazardia aedis USNM 41457]|uniref:CNH domain-containing protein n=1 Tax=Edhazardia aedis (strain USNM 41457) TaxID=1003232 RepID=J9D2H4_EDHAE|nr:hypothetical protein EDEG_00370 [Edhazardia aedis USNM 41457]|eukprot:EJW01779.1 hypothetical protein EDEG_00370 [Edhazardia aedis USNM 41457]